jgi:hypothetical protein
MNASATWQHEQTTANAAPSGPKIGRAGKKGLLGGYTHIVRSAIERCSSFLGDALLFRHVGISESGLFPSTSGWGRGSRCCLE